MINQHWSIRCYIFQRITHITKDQSGSGELYCIWSAGKRWSIHGVTSPRFPPNLMTYNKKLRVTPKLKIGNCNGNGKVCILSTIWMWKLPTYISHCYSESPSPWLLCPDTSSINDRIPTPIFYTISLPPCKLNLDCLNTFVLFQHHLVTFIQHIGTEKGWFKMYFNAAAYMVPILDKGSDWSGDPSVSVNQSIKAFNKDCGSD